MWLIRGSATWGFNQGYKGKIDTVHNSYVFVVSHMGNVNMLKKK